MEQKNFFKDIICSKCYSIELENALNKMLDDGQISLESLQNQLQIEADQAYKVMDELLKFNYVKQVDKGFEFIITKREFNKIITSRKRTIDNCLQKNKKSKEFGFKVKIGKDDDGKDFFYDIKQMPNLLVVGNVGCGKTQFIQKILVKIATHKSNGKMQAMVVDLSDCEFKRLKNLQNNLFPICTTKEQTTNMINYVGLIKSARKQLLESQSIENIDIYNKTSKEKLEHIFVIIDEIAYFDNYMLNNFFALMDSATKLGIYFIVATRKTDNSVITKEIKQKFNCVCCFKVNNSNESIFFVDKIGAERLVLKEQNFYCNLPDQKLVRVKIGEYEK